MPPVQYATKADLEAVEKRITDRFEDLRGIVVAQAAPSRAWEVIRVLGLAALRPASLALLVVLAAVVVGGGQAAVALVERWSPMASAATGGVTLTDGEGR